MDNRIQGHQRPVITLPGNTGLQMMEMVLVGSSRLAGEVIGINDQKTTVQVYEETTGLRPGEPVYTTGGPLCATLGPGILDNIFDGIERPLQGDRGKIRRFHLPRGQRVRARREEKMDSYGHGEARRSAECWHGVRYLPGNRDYHP